MKPSHRWIYVGQSAMSIVAIMFVLSWLALLAPMTMRQRPQPPHQTDPTPAQTPDPSTPAPAQSKQEQSVAPYFDLRSGQKLFVRSVAPLCHFSFVVLDGSEPISITLELTRIQARMRASHAGETYEMTEFLVGLVEARGLGLAEIWSSIVKSPNPSRRVRDLMDQLKINDAIRHLGLSAEWRVNVRSDDHVTIDLGEWRSAIRLKLVCKTYLAFVAGKACDEALNVSFDENAQTRQPQGLKLLRLAYLKDSGE